jgi:hypothetical protein
MEDAMRPAKRGIRLAMDLKNMDNYNLDVN